RKLNDALSKIPRQMQLLKSMDAATDRPFFHCWFLSLPQLMVLLDDVHDNESFRTALWKTRHIITGSSDFYHDLAYMRNLMSTAEVPNLETGAIGLRSE
ncbi:MAG: hypothetical protein ABSA58_21420, partial [Acetobacteraceae bacterium]